MIGEGEPAVLRRAKALAHILENMPVFVEDQQLIAGNYAESPNHLVHFIEQNWRSVQRVIQPGAPGETLVDDVGLKEFDALCEYWDGRSLREILSESMPDEMKSTSGMKVPFCGAFYRRDLFPITASCLKSV